MPSDARPSSAAPEQPQPPGAQIGDVMGGLANETRPVVPGARGGMREAPSEPPWQTEGNTEPKGLAARARSLHGERSVPVLTEAQAADAPPGTTYRLPNDPPGTVRTVPGPRRR